MKATGKEKNQRRQQRQQKTFEILPLMNTKFHILPCFQIFVTGKTASEKHEIILLLI